MDKLDQLLDHMVEPDILITILRECKHAHLNCDDDNKSVIVHDNCLDVFQHDNKNLNIPQCSFNVLKMITRILCKKPQLIDENVRAELVNYYKRNNIMAEGLISEQVLESLDGASSNQTLIWIKYEALLAHLIKEMVYEPKTVANEVLRMAKNEVRPKLAAKFSSALNGCVKFCKEVNHKHSMDDEEQEKWCEIIDWMSWFLADTDADGLGDL